MLYMTALCHPLYPPSYRTSDRDKLAMVVLCGGVISRVQSRTDWHCLLRMLIFDSIKLLLLQSSHFLVGRHLLAAVAAGGGGGGRGAPLSLARYLGGSHVVLVAARLVLDLVLLRHPETEKSTFIWTIQCSKAECT